MTYTVGELFAGVGGMGRGFEQAGFRVAWQVENDKDCISVLERHWPDVPRYGDIREVNGADLGPVDVVVFGSPCQDFSVAGKRAGMDGERSGLFHEAIRIIAGLRPAPAFCVWEGVPGTLSSAGGRDFGAALDALAQCGALDIAWRVLDARWWGVAQRRRRIFLVGDFGAERAASVLFESEGSGRDSPPSGAEGQGAPGDAADGAGVVGEPDVAYCLPASARGTGDAHGNAWNTTYVGWQESQSGTRVGDTVGALDANYGSRRHNGAAFAENYHATRITDTAPTIGAKHGLDPLQNAGGLAVVMGGIESGNGYAIARTMNCQQGIGDPTAQTFLVESVAISENQQAEVRETPYANALVRSGGKTGQGYQGVRTGVAVRRLTPRECERLMSWPDDHTRWRTDGSEIPDGPRYRMIGNGVVSSVAYWIAERLRRTLEATI